MRTEDLPVIGTSGGLPAVLFGEGKYEPPVFEDLDLPVGHVAVGRKKGELDLHPWVSEGYIDFESLPDRVVILGVVDVYYSHHRRCGIVAQKDIVYLPCSGGLDAPVEAIRMWDRAFSSAYYVHKLARQGTATLGSLLRRTR